MKISKTTKTIKIRQPKIHKYIISKMGYLHPEYRYYFDGERFVRVYEEPGILGFNPVPMYSMNEYLEMRVVDELKFSDTALMDKKGNCAVSVSTCEKSFKNRKFLYSQNN